MQALKLMNYGAVGLGERRLVGRDEQVRLGAVALAGVADVVRADEGDHLRQRARPVGNQQARGFGAARTGGDC